MRSGRSSRRRPRCPATASPCPSADRAANARERSACSLSISANRQCATTSPPRTATMRVVDRIPARAARDAARRTPSTAATASASRPDAAEAPAQRAITTSTGNQRSGGTMRIADVRDARRCHSSDGQPRVAAAGVRSTHRIARASRSARVRARRAASGLSRRLPARRYRPAGCVACSKPMQHAFLQRPRLQAPTRRAVARTREQAAFDREPRAVFAQRGSRSTAAAPAAIDSRRSRPSNAITSVSAGQRVFLRAEVVRVGPAEQRLAPRIRTGSPTRRGRTASTRRTAPSSTSRPRLEIRPRRSTSPSDIVEQQRSRRGLRRSARRLRRSRRDGAPARSSASASSSAQHAHLASGLSPPAESSRTSATPNMRCSTDWFSDDVVDARERDLRGAGDSSQPLRIDQPVAADL